MRASSDTALRGELRAVALVDGRLLVDLVEGPVELEFVGHGACREAKVVGETGLEPVTPWL